MRCIRAIDREILQFMQCPRAGHSRLHAQKTRACARWPENPQIFARRGADKHRKGAPPWAESPAPHLARETGGRLGDLPAFLASWETGSQRGLWRWQTRSCCMIVCTIARVSSSAPVPQSQCATEPMVLYVTLHVYSVCEWCGRPQSEQCMIKFYRIYILTCWSPT